MPPELNGRGNSSSDPFEFVEREFELIAFEMKFVLVSVGRSDGTRLRRQ